jgi:hypothetical protein
MVTNNESGTLGQLQGQDQGPLAVKEMDADAHPVSNLASAGRLRTSKSGVRVFAVFS